MLRIEEMFAFIAQDAEGEGVPAISTSEGVMPLIAADEARVESLREIAQKVASGQGITITLCRFSVREEIEVITPAGTTGA